jgi:hypothetical protein
MLDLHLAEDGRAIVCDGDVAVGGDENLVETSRAEGRADDVCDGPRGEDVGLRVGERVDRRVTVRTLMASMPWLRVFLACSLRMMNGLPLSEGQN